MIEKLHFITHSPDPALHLKQVEMACKAAVKWIQLRVKNQNKEVIKEVAEQARSITSLHGVQLCINDHLDIALSIGADACHLGKNDMPIHAAKALAGDKLIIGATCNTIEDVYSAYEAGTDYIGLGPYRHTQTKEQLSPILGIEGYQEIMQRLKERKIDLPIISIGGIQLDDITPLLNTGLHGIAVSGLLTQAEDFERTSYEIQHLLNYKNEQSYVANS